MRRGAEPQNIGELGETDRYVVHVATDKPIYRTSERLYVRGMFLRADGHTPMTPSLNPTASFEIKGPKGDTVASGSAAIIDSVAGFSWDIPAGQAGGEYTVRISHPSADGRAERKFDIRTYRAPRLKSQIVFVRDGYGPGDMVAANLHVERAEGGIPAGARVSVSVRVDGEQTWTGTATVDGSGNAGASFRLPAAIARGEGVDRDDHSGWRHRRDRGENHSDSFADDGSGHLSRRRRSDRGSAQPGLRCKAERRRKSLRTWRVSFVNAAGKEVAAFRTEHEGRGRFSFVPSKGESYSLRITEPAGIKTFFALPAVKESGVVISSLSDITAREKDVKVRVGRHLGGFLCRRV